MSLSLIVLAAGLGLQLAGLDASAVPQSLPVVLPQTAHPCVFLSGDELKSLRARTDSEEWAAKIRKNLIDAAEELVKEPLAIPHEGGQWSHWYSCQEDGGHLKAESPTRHVCTVCGKVYSGPPYDQVYVSQQHHHWLGGVEVLGVAYACQATPAYAERVRAILLEYASLYSALPLHDTKARPNCGAHLFAQTLDEAVMFCRVVLGYDMVYDAPCFAKEDHDAIRDGLLLPVVRTIQSNNRSISNWQAWHNAAVGCIGFLLRDPQLVDWAVNGKSGFLLQMRSSLMPGGMWYEESPSYHFYALTSHVYLMEAALRAGMNLYGIPQVKGMFDAPIRQLLPDFTFVPLQDSDRTSILSEAPFYDVAYAHYHDSQYLPLIKERNGVWPLLWGVEQLPESPSETSVTVPSDVPGDGLAVLRDRANQTVLCFDYGAGRSGHAHPAKLGISLYALGDIRFVDPGRVRYGNPMHHGWFTQTLAHNTVVVNQTSQKRTPGTLKAFAHGDSYGLCRAVCTTAYEEPVTLDRTVLLCNRVIVDVFRCSAGADSVFDLPLHVTGVPQHLPEMEPVEGFGTHDGYQQLKNVRRCKEPLNELDIAVEKDGVIHANFWGISESYLAEGYGEEMKTLCPAVISRATGKDVCFVAVYQVLRPGETPVPVKVKTGRKTSVEGNDFRLAVGKRTHLEFRGKNCPVSSAE